MEVIVLGAVTSSVYALLAVGFTLIFGVARIINLAHGAFYAVAGYAAYILINLGGWPVLPAMLAAVLITALFGVAVDRVFVRPLRHSHMAVLMITLAISMAVEQGLTVAFLGEARSLPPLIDGKVSVLGVDVAAQRLLTLLVSVVLIGALWLFIQRSRLGAAILAISQDPEAAEYVGIPAERIFALVMGLSAALAASASVLASPFLSVQPSMGLLPMVKAFCIVIIGGLGSIPGSILAACLLGFTETFVAFHISSTWSEVISVAAVFAMLALRPAGLLGKREAF
ncbi:branched-chain amino acid transport system permease protein [Roseomonas rosea]|uniref:Branched-chain amino acid transport system permease protein n=1 Tax=Muricoccus roseus TaxID=198092 RepID=A0A1M6PU13_9PROT|nr:branched-chain amino acid ABC transporter permease [Roseomonas rosea]SHK11402.1 branched-chain amino acid transport system permease protein [Roseomonas rosea]